MRRNTHQLISVSEAAELLDMQGMAAGKAFIEATRTSTMKHPEEIGEETIAAYNDAALNLAMVANARELLENPNPENLEERLAERARFMITNAAKHLTAPSDRYVATSGIFSPGHPERQRYMLDDIEERLDYTCGDNRKKQVPFPFLVAMGEVRIV